MRIVIFMQPGGLSRTVRLSGGPDFWVERGDIALQVGEVVQVRNGHHGMRRAISWEYEKDIVPLLMSDGTQAFAICAPGGWNGSWVEAL